MAEVDIADIIATVDGDTTWGADMRGAVTTLRDRSFPVPTLNTASLTGVRSLYMTAGATTGLMSADSQKPKGNLVYVPACTPVSVSVEVTTLQAASDVYVSVHNVRSADGMPGTIAAQYGPFDGTTVGVKTVTGQTTAIPSGWYWVMEWNTVTGNTCRAFNQASVHHLWMNSTWSGTAVPAGINYGTVVGSTTPIDLTAQNPTITSANGGIIRVAITE